MYMTNSLAHQRAARRKHGALPVCAHVMLHKTQGDVSLQGARQFGSKFVTYCHSQDQVLLFVACTPSGMTKAASHGMRVTVMKSTQLTTCRVA
jgi:hypothetical protein